MLHIVLHEPEMPANTGNIGRTCVACGAVLHLIEPLGFRLNEKMIKRAGLDYWDKLDVRTYINFEDFLEKNNDPKIYMATTKAKHVYSAPAYEDDEDVYIMFGKESAGIPEEILLNYEETSIRIPMLPHIRSLNLSNSLFAIFNAISSFKLLNTTILSSLFLNSGVKNFLISSLIASPLIILSPNPITDLPISLAPALEVIIKRTFLKSAFLP